MSAARHMVVGRLRKPHGLKGDSTLFPLTDDPGTVFAPGRSVWLVGLDGDEVAGPLTIERSRSYHREWLVKFAGADGREALEPWRGLFLAVPAEQLKPPADDEVYLHELAGFAVRLPDETPLGLVSAVYETAGGPDDRGAGAEAGIPAAVQEAVRAAGGSGGAAADGLCSTSCPANSTPRSGTSLAGAFLRKMPSRRGSGRSGASSSKPTSASISPATSSSGCRPRRSV